MSALRSGLRRPAHVVGLSVVLVALVLAAVGAGFAATFGTARLSPQPAVFLSVGLLSVTVVGAAGFWLALRRQQRPRRARLTLLSTTLLLLMTAAAVTTSLPDSPAASDPVPGLAYWQLNTGSRLAYVKRPGTAPVRSTPIVMLHGGPGIPDLAADVAFFGQLADLGFDVYVYDQLGAGRSTRLTDPADRSGDLATTGLDTGTHVRSYAAALAPRALLGYTLLQANPAAAHAYLGDSETDARNDTSLTIAEPALHCSPQQNPRPVRASGFYALQYPQSATAPTPRDVRPALTRLPTPTLIFKGSCDYLSWHSATTYRQVLPHSELLYVKGAGHNTYQDQPDIVIRAIRAFLSDQPLPQAPYLPTKPPDGYRGPP